MLTRNEIIKKAKDLARQLNTKSLSKKAFIAKTGITEWYIIKLFDNWNEVIIEAKLIPANNIKLKNEELFNALLKTFLKNNGICTQLKFRKINEHSLDIYKQRFGSWTNILSVFRNWIKNANKDFPYMVTLEEQISRSNSIKKIIRCGSFLNFRSLQHAPTNEQGVVFLFGMICFELGYIIEIIKTGFPDCEAKRKVAGCKEEWEKIKIEFEFKSKHFLEHGHNKNDCDLIVCWKHNWPECPIEVLELRNEINNLTLTGRLNAKNK